MVLWVRGLLTLLCLLMVSACQGYGMPTGAAPIYVDFKSEARSLANKEDSDKLLLCERRACKGGVDLLAPVKEQGAHQLATRNQIQHAILGRSTFLCNEFKQTLARNSRSYTLTMRTLTHLFTGASTVTKGRHYAKVFSGVGGLSTAIGDDIDAMYGHNVAIALSGIELARTRIFRQILKHQNDSLVEYPLSRAVNDALRYHSVCNLVEGIEESSAAVENAIGQAGGSAPPAAMPVLSVEHLRVTGENAECSVSLDPPSTWPVVATAVLTFHNEAGTPVESVKELILTPGKTSWECKHPKGDAVEVRVILHSASGAVVGTSVKTVKIPATQAGSGQASSGAGEVNAAEEPTAPSVPPDADASASQ